MTAILRHSSAMFETRAELAELQSLLDASLAGATEHLQSIVTPGQRTLTAEQVTSVCRGMCTLAISTVTATGEPRISAVDGHLLHGRWYFSTARGAAKARHLAAQAGRERRLPPRRGSRRLHARTGRAAQSGRRPGRPGLARPPAVHDRLLRTVHRSAGATSSTTGCGRTGW